MSRHGSFAGLLAETLVFGFIVAAADAAETSEGRLTRQPTQIELFQALDTSAWRQLSWNITPLPQRFHLELNGARASAEDWLRDAGLSVREERDPEGHRSYTVLSDTLLSADPVIRLRAQVGRPELAAGLRLRQNSATLGLTIPWQRYVVELEGVDDRSLGCVFLGSLRWRDAHDHLQYGVAVPIAAGRAPAVGVLLQLHLQFSH